MSSKCACASSSYIMFHGFSERSCTLWRLEQTFETENQTGFNTSIYYHVSSRYYFPKIWFWAVFFKLFIIYLIFIILVWKWKIIMYARPDYFQTHNQKFWHITHCVWSMSFLRDQMAQMLLQMFLVRVLS